MKSNKLFNPFSLFVEFILYVLLVYGGYLRAACISTNAGLINCQVFFRRGRRRATDCQPASMFDIQLIGSLSSETKNPPPVLLPD